MSGGWQISAGDVSETLRPAFYALAVAASAWVLASARRHGGFRQYAVWAWTLCTFVSPTVVLPLYLVARLFTRRPAPNVTTPESDQNTPPGEVAGPEDVESSGGTGKPQAAPPFRRRLVPPLLYAAVLSLAGGIYFYQDYRSFDAHLARGARAKLYKRRGLTISEYRAALRVREDAHTQKLLGLELLEEGRAAEALAALLAAERGGEPDPRLPYRVAAALDALDRRAEAAEAYGRFGRGPLCAQPHPDILCAAASERLRALGRSPG